MEIIWLNKNPVIDLHRGSSLRRRLNSWLVGVALKFGLSYVPGYPRHLILDLVNVCGLRCPICPQGRCEINRKPAKSDINFFRDLMDKIGPYLYTLTLTNWGEPLKHPDALKLMEYARKFPCYIGFSTNLQDLTDEMIEDLLQSGIDEIGCSIDGCTEETYKTYRIGGNFQTAMTNMKKLVRKRAEIGVKIPKIRWQVLLNRYTEKEIDQIIETAEEIGVDSLVFLPIFLDIARMFTHTPLERLERDGNWLPENAEYSWYNYKTGDLKKITRKCSKLWDSIVVHPDGAVSPCCAVIDEKHDFGKLDDMDSFRDVWNGREYRAARNWMAGRRSDPLNNVCEQCIKHGILIY